MYGSSSRHAVDRDPALAVAAGDLVAGQADHPLDEVRLARAADPDQVADGAAELGAEAGC